jgi:hypothetical protein
MRIGTGADHQPHGKRVLHRRRALRHDHAKHLLEGRGVEIQRVLHAPGDAERLHALERTIRRIVEMIDPPAQIADGHLSMTRSPQASRLWGVNVLEDPTAQRQQLVMHIHREAAVGGFEQRRN